MTPVADLEARRRASASRLDEPATCPCGSAWWTLRGPDAGRTSHIAGAEHGAVAARADGTITAYVGDLVCLECGEPGPSAADAAGRV